MLSRFFFLFLLCSLLHCGIDPRGGIVDNGNEPTEPEDPNQSRQDDSSRSPSSGQAFQDPLTLVILDEFILQVPSPHWNVEDTSATATMVTNDDNQTIVFLKVSETCDVAPEKNEFDIDIYWCSPNKTVYAIGGGAFVKAEHDDRTKELVSILKSFHKHEPKRIQQEDL